MRIAIDKKGMASGLMLIALAAVGARAAEPIFVTPPAEESRTQKSASESQEQLPIAKTIPLNAPRSVQDENTAIFVSPPVTQTEDPIDSGREAPSVPETQPNADLARPSAAPTPDGVSEKAKAAEASEGSGVAVDNSTTDELPPAPMPMLDLPRLTEQKGLPLELDLMQSKLVRIIDEAELLPADAARASICNEADHLVGLANKLERAPLIEMTTHFSLWRGAVGRLSASAQGMQQHCKTSPNNAAADYRVIVENFEKVLKAR